MFAQTAKEVPKCSEQCRRPTPALVHMNKLRRRMSGSWCVTTGVIHNATWTELLRWYMKTKNHLIGLGKPHSDFKGLLITI